MPVSLMYDTEDNFLWVRLCGRLTREDYERFEPEVECLIGEEGMLRILVEMHDFHGWTAGGLWEEIKFDARHFSDVDRLALVGETRWQELLADLCRPFTTANVRFFGADEASAARAWLTGTGSSAALRSELRRGTLTER